MRTDKAFERNPNREYRVSQTTDLARTVVIPAWAEVVEAMEPAVTENAVLTLQLPNVSEAVGQHIAVYCIAPTTAPHASASIKITVGSDSTLQGTSGLLVTLDFTGEYALFYCDGRSWFVVDSVTNLS